MHVFQLTPALPRPEHPASFCSANESAMPTANPLTGSV
jgi:hypothetical protein